jgi:hypothetical protein
LSVVCDLVEADLHCGFAGDEQSLRTHYWCAAGIKPGRRRLKRLSRLKQKQTHCLSQQDHLDDHGTAIRGTITFEQADRFDTRKWRVGPTFSWPPPTNGWAGSASPKRRWQNGSR